ncbi:hypothetical protein GF342_05025 [Candidatus Woesearchaeota archaeon]|nr:hypothetical protein [Candidatus Woesearchaeota archaeon]
MNKRGMVINKAIELMFAAVLFLGAIYLLIQLVTPALSNQPSQAEQDFERYVIELNALQPGDTIPVRTIGSNYTIGLYAGNAHGPKSCGSKTCLCLYDTYTDAEHRRVNRCETFENIHTTCGAYPCLAQPITLLTKRLVLTNEVPVPEVFYFCMNRDKEITLTKEESEC